jgi:hypothetical protein
MKHTLKLAPTLVPYCKTRSWSMCFIVCPTVIWFSKEDVIGYYRKKFILFSLRLTGPVQPHKCETCHCVLLSNGDNKFWSVTNQRYARACNWMDTLLINITLFMNKCCFFSSLIYMNVYVTLIVFFWFVTPRRFVEGYTRLYMKFLTTWKITWRHKPEYHSWQFHRC